VITPAEVKLNARLVVALLKNAVVGEGAQRVLVMRERFTPLLARFELLPLAEDVFDPRGR
jgi:hypothetical protein